MSARSTSRILPSTKALLRPTTKATHSVIPSRLFATPRIHALRNVPVRTISLIPRWPEREFSSLFRLLDDYTDHVASRNTPTGVRSFAPRFDVRETKEAYHLDGEMPGISQKDVDIEFTDPHTLVIKGKTEREYSSPNASEGDKNADHRYWVSERSIGEFHRTFTFPTRVDQDRVKASLKDGVLSIEVPKAAPAAAKKITVT
ncbi:hypothetical protein DTO027B5_2439 [Paecilomyces variotii]|nr:hypothetical protein DTO169C6_2617 [Paecilomyces variotii]KAJ9288107.1 hypothetical protein DTO021C3_4280 [Paecilomyces variotii]KAJ9329033.1 hypothetical protein DTO027B3_433 [Paecilomyces variotii]KAJ9335846.1 hypothetical protein DTO027B5_2439 [Paecilomyces variotii]